MFRYDGKTGAFLGVFVQAQNNGGLDHPLGLAFGPDGHLYVGGAESHSIVRFNGTTGAFMNVFVPAERFTERRGRLRHHLG